MPETHKAIPLTQHKAGAPKTESSWAKLSRWQPPPPTPMLMAAQVEELEGSREYRVSAVVQLLQEQLRASEAALLAEQHAADRAGSQGAPAPVPPSPTRM